MLMGWETLNSNDIYFILFKFSCGPYGMHTSSFGLKLDDLVVTNQQCSSPAAPETFCLCLIRCHAHADSPRANLTNEEVESLI